MASRSEAATAEAQAFIERFMISGNRDLTLFIPFLVAIQASTVDSITNPDDADLDQDSPNSPNPEGNQRDGLIILINPLTRGMVVIDGANLGSLVDSLPIRGKDGQPPASEASIAAMRSVVVREREEDDEGECAICLGEWEVGGLAKEMPCKHRFHEGCVEKWLRIHGSCPVCRYKLPAGEEDDERKKRAGDVVEGQGGSGEERGG